MFCICLHLLIQRILSDLLPSALGIRCVGFFGIRVQRTWIAGTTRYLIREHPGLAMVVSHLKSYELAFESTGVVSAVSNANSHPNDTQKLGAPAQAPPQ